MPAALTLDADIEPVLGEFISSRRGLVEAIDLAIARGERGEVRRVAHQLAGSFSLYGFQWAAAQCRAIESDFSQITAEQLRRATAELRRHLDTVEIRYEVS